MNRQYMEYGAIAILGIVLVVVVGRAIMGGGDKAPAANSATQAKKATTEAKTPVAEGEAEKLGDDIDPDELLQEIQEVTFVYTERETDPMMPLLTGALGAVGMEDKVDVRPGVVLTRLKIRAIVWDQADPVAIVNDGMGDNPMDRLIFEGYEYAKGMVVESILPDRIIFDLGTSKYPVYLQTEQAGEQTAKAEVN